MTAYGKLKEEGINIRVVDPFTLKPIDKDLLVASANATGGRVVTVEDHYAEGELALFVLAKGVAGRSRIYVWIYHILLLLHPLLISLKHVNELAKDSLLVCFFFSCLQVVLVRP